jgi:hypothetical protein
VLVQVEIEGQRRAVTFHEPVEEPLVDRVGAIGVERRHVGELGVQEVAVTPGTRPGQVRAEPALGHQPDLAGPGRDHGAHVRGLVLAELAREAEQDDVLQRHCRSCFR